MTWLHTFQTLISLHTPLLSGCRVLSLFIAMQSIARQIYLAVPEEQNSRHFPSIHWTTLLPPTAWFTEFSTDILLNILSFDFLDFFWNKEGAWSITIIHSNDLRNKNESHISWSYFQICKFLVKVKCPYEHELNSNHIRKAAKNLAQIIM